jgi:anti-sigma B factor antagonist
MATPTDFNCDGPITVEQKRYGDDVLVVALSGELDAAVVDTARAALEAAVDDPCGLVVIDLTALEFLDSSGVALLYELARTRPEKDRLRLLRGNHAGVTRVLELTQVDQVMSVVPS